jgi:hypothetical protein
MLYGQAQLSLAIYNIHQEHDPVLAAVRDEDRFHIGGGPSEMRAHPPGFMYGRGASPARTRVNPEMWFPQAKLPCQ